MERNFEYLLVEQCAPTLMCLKPASLFRYCPDDRAKAYGEAAKWNGILNARGIAVRILKECARTGDLLIYVYREKMLRRTLEAEAVCGFLRENGYHPELGIDSLLADLSKRLCMDAEFPHEIGIFLGYPLCDVIGFIENRGQHYTCCGCWKSYSDPEEAQKRFDAFHTCTRMCRKWFEQGATVVQLTVAA